ncbi:MAG TPA: acyltransferase [Micropepsaceae bacterium]|nr:acyltransferase [Micropepsaceae bacterium]
MGAIRLFLACGVVFAHAASNVLRDAGLTADKEWWLNIVGGRAVIFFYIVSGFLISYALHEKYPPTTSGSLTFFRSRFLRIFPLWWALLIVCLVIDAPPWPAEHSPIVLVPAVTLFGTDWLVAFWTYPARYWGTFPLVLRVGWTLGAELTFYLIAPWALRSSKIAITLFLVSAMVRLMSLAVAGPIRLETDYLTWTYYFFPATLMFFMLGHFANMIARSLPLGATASIVALALAGFFSWLEQPISVDRLPSYLSCLCFAAALPGLFAVTKDSRIFNFLGDLTYPLFLTHTMTVAVLFGPWKIARPLGQLLLAGAGYFGSPAIGGALLIAAILGIAIPVAAVAHFAIERPARKLVAMFLSHWMSDRIPARA